MNKEKLFVEESGNWVQIFAGRRAGNFRGAVFLDRDGVIVEEVNYLHRVQDMRLITGAAETIRQLNQRKIAAVVVTNQAGVGRNYYDWRHFAEVQAALVEQLKQHDAQLDAVLACPFHRDARPPYQHPDHPARKPNPGMLLTAAERLDIDLGRAWIIGDRATDVRAGLNAGCAGGYLVRTGHGGRDIERDSAAVIGTPEFSVAFLDSIADLTAHPPLSG